MMQAESWIKDERTGQGRYQIAVLMCWSYQLSNLAQAILDGKHVVITGLKPGTKSLDEWVAGRGERWDVKVGPWVYIDNKGELWFLGIASEPLPRDYNLMPITTMRVKEMAREMVAHSLFRDAYVRIGSEKESALLQAIGNLDQDTAWESHQDRGAFYQSAFRDMNISGLTERFQTEATHRASGKRMFVSVFAVSSKNSANARNIREFMRKVAIDINNSQEIQRGENASWEQLIKASADNPAARAEGAAGVRTSPSMPQSTPGTPQKEPQTPPRQQGNPEQPGFTPGVWLEE